MLIISYIYIYLWDGKAGNGEARDDIRPEKFEGVIRSPMENREEKLKTQYEFCEESLVVVESVKRVIREENLR